MDFRDDIETKPKPMPPGMNDTEFAFYGILMAEIARVRDDDAIDQSTHDEVIAVTKKLVGMLDEATGRGALGELPTACRELPAIAYGPIGVHRRT